MLPKLPLYLHISHVAVLLQISDHSSSHPTSFCIRGRKKWLWHQSVFPALTLLVKQPLTFLSSIWLLNYLLSIQRLSHKFLYSNIAWSRPKDRDLYTILIDFTCGSGTSSKPSGNSSNPFMYLPSSLLFGLLKRGTFLGKSLLTAFTAHISVHGLWFYPCSRYEKPTSLVKNNQLLAFLNCERDSLHCNLFLGTSI